MSRVGRGAVAALLTVASMESAVAETGSPPTLVLAFDCLPYETVARLTDPDRGEGAVFTELTGPVPLISSFPSTTSVAFGGILAPLELPLSPGYEARFFDWRLQRVRGGMPWSYYRIGFHWRDFFDWNRKGPIRRMVSALRPVRATLAWFERAIDAFLESDEEVFFVYNGATDTLAHLRGPDGFAPVLAGLERMLERARQERQFHLVMLSDHGLGGGEPLRNVLRPVKRALRGAGYRYRRRLRQPRDVALTPFGLVSSFEIYTQRGHEATVARAVAAVDGVDLCVRRAGDDWMVVDAEGEAAFQRRGGGSEWRYRARDADPLDYERLGGGDWHGDRWWLTATAGHRYPDALYRLARSFELVDNPASILCSVDSGWMFGARKTALAARLRGGRLRWTHGAVERDATLGFIMSDLPGWEPQGPVRFDEALLPLAGRDEP